MEVSDGGGVKKEVEEIIKGNGKKGKVPDLWDGKAAGRIVEIIAGELIG